MEASEASRYIFDWIESITLQQSGMFVEPNIGEMPW